MKKFIMILFFALCMVGCSNGAGNEYEEEYYEEEREYSGYVDVEALKAIEDQDKFGLRVVDTAYKENCFVDNGYGDDNAIVYIENFSSKTIVEFQIYTVAYTQDLTKALFHDEEDVTWYTVSDVYIEPGDVYNLEIVCHGEAFYDFNTFIKDYQTETGEYCENELGEEWYDVALYGTGEEPEVSISFPPEEDYDEIVDSDERYFLCKKYESGFEEETMLYGIYDGELREWAVEFVDLGNQEHDFYNNGDGVFSFSSSNGYTSNTYFISADYGGVFDIDIAWISTYEEIFFNEGKAFVFIENDDQDDITEPDEYIYRLSTLGELEKVDIPNYNRNDCYWKSANIVDVDDETIYARIFKGYTEDYDKHCLYVYFYEEDEAVVIDIEKYYENMSLSMGVEDGNSLVSFDGEFIRIENLTGADDELYYVEYDKNGNLVTEPTLM